jgi:hypothetical protein
MPGFLLAALIGVDPVTLVQWLRAGDARAAKAVGVERARDVRLAFIQLDDDAAEEAVLQFDDGRGVAAVVLDARGAGWEIAGKFNDWWNYKPAHADRFIELRETVDGGVKDLLVRTHGGGTEEETIDVELFRMRAGKLIPVWKANEYSYKMEHPSGKAATSVSVVAFPEPGRAVVRTGTVCRAFVWSRESFRFEEAAGGGGCR